MVAKRTVDVAALAAAMTEREFLGVVREYLTRNKGELDFVVITGHAKGHPGPDFVIPVVSTRRSPTARGPRPRRA